MAALEESLYRQFKSVFIIISLFVILAAAPALWLTELSSGSGGAINVSGSLRMQSYKMALAVAAPYESQDDRREHTTAEVREFARRLESRELLRGIPRSPEDPIRSRYDALAKTFRSDIEPLAIESIEDAAARGRFVERVPVFVADVDAFVFSLESTLSGRLTLLKTMLTAVLLGSIAVTFMTLGVMRRKIFEPLKELESALGEVRRGGFDARVPATRRDEIGRLGRDFNFMAEELSRLYGSLEAEVSAKTADLDRRNQILRFLNHATEALQVDGADFERAVAAILTEAAAFTGSEAAALFVRVSEGTEAVRFAATSAWREDAAAEARPVPASDGRELGTLATIGAPDEAWVENVRTMLARILGRAIENTLRKQDDRRLAVLEERSTIARELHDSIAQSLSFSRIQLLRLSRAIDADRPRSEVAEIAAELKEGIGEAYRQLREVLTAFRLQVNASGLAGAVEETVRSFEQRTGLPVKLANRWLGAELTANELVHVAHILREALANVEKHARAKSVAVTLERLEDGGFRLEVRDDGIGIPEAARKEGHFGLGIMAERARALGGELFCERAPQGGTIVRLIRKGRSISANSQ